MPSEKPEELKLAPCPFCGEKDNKLWVGIALYYVECQHCGGATTTFYEAKKAIAAWNRRAATPTNSPAGGDNNHLVCPLCKDMVRAVTAVCTTHARIAAGGDEAKLWEKLGNRCEEKANDCQRMVGKLAWADMRDWCRKQARGAA